MKDYFHIFSTHPSIEVDDQSDFQVLLQDEVDTTPACMAVTALTIYQLEHGYDRGRMQMLFWALNTHCRKSVRMRARIGIIFVMANLDVRDRWALEQLAECISYEPDACYEAYRAILQIFTRNEEFDVNYLLFQMIYGMPPFSKSPDLFFRPFARGQVENLSDEDWTFASSLTKAWHLCDSDRFALLLMLMPQLDSLRATLMEQNIDPEALADMQIHVERLASLSGEMKRAVLRMTKGSPLTDYVQQLYRFIQAHPQYRHNLQRQTMTDRMLIVDRQQENALWQ